MDVRAYIDANASGFFAELKEWLRIPSISGDPEHADDVRRTAEWLADTLRATGFPTVEVWETAGPAGGVRRVAERRPGRADRRSSTATTTCSRSTRSSCGSTRRSSRRSTATQLHRARRRRRQGAGPLPHCSACGRISPRPAAPPRAVNLKLLVEGEEESGLAALRRPAARARATGWPATSSSSATPPCGRARRPTRVHRHARHDRRPGRPARAVRRPALRLVRRRGAQPAARAGRAARRPARRRRPRHHRRLLRRHRRAHRRGARAVRQAALRRGRRGSRRRRSRAALRRGGLHHPGAHLGTADRRDQRHVGRPHRPRRQDDRARGGAREGVLPARRRAGPARGAASSSRDCTSPSTPRRASRPRSRSPGRACGRASRRSTPRRARRPRRAMETAFGTEVLFTREGGSGPEADLPTSWKHRSSSSASACPTTGSTRPTRRSRCRCCSRAPRPRRTSGTSSPIASESGPP